MRKLFLVLLLVFTSWLPAAHVYLDGVSGTYISLPDSAQVSVTGDIDIRVEVAMDAWTGAEPTIISKYVGGDISFRFSIRPDGKLRLRLSDDLTSIQTATSTAATGFSAGTLHWIRVTYNTSSHVTKFYISSDGTSWSQLGTDNTNITLNSIADSSTVVEIGSLNVGTAQNATGKFYSAQIYSDLTETTKVLDWQASSMTVLGGDDDATPSAGTWVFNGGALLYPDQTVVDEVTYNFVSDELVTNGLFTTDFTGWTSQNSVITTISSGVANLENGDSLSGTIYQTIDTTSSALYLATITRLHSSGPSIRHSGNDGTTNVNTGSQFTQFPVTTGEYRTIFTGASSQTTIGVWINSSTLGFNIDFDNVSVREIEATDPNQVVVDSVTYNIISNELVTNGIFIQDSDWTKSANVTISGGEAIWTNAANAETVQQNNFLTIGKTYYVTAEVTSYTNGEFFSRQPFNDFLNGVTATGIYEAVGVATSDDFHLRVDGTATNLSIDNATLLEVELAPPTVITYYKQSNIMAMLSIIAARNVPSGPVTATMLDQDANTSTGSFTMDFTGSVSGDILLLPVAYKSDVADPSTPSGFTLLTSPQSGTSSSDSQTFVYWKVSDGTETTVVITLGGTTSATAFAIAVHDASTSTPAFTDSTSTGSNFNLTGVTVPTDGLAIQFATVKDQPNANTWAPPGTVTLLGTLQTANTVETLASFEETEGATGTLAYTFGNFAYFSGTHIIFEPL